MQGEDLEAGNNLRTISQRTSYITDWTQSIKTKTNRYQKAIPEEEPETLLPLVARRRPQIQKQTSDKYDLKKYEKKLQVIQRQESIFTSQRIESKPEKLRQQMQKADGNIANRRKNKSLPWMRPVEAEYLRRQVQLIQRKNSGSQRELQIRMIIHRQKPTRQGLNAKLAHQMEKRGRVVVTDQDIADIKRMISKGCQRSSLAYLTPMDVLPSIRALH